MRAARVVEITRDRAEHEYGRLTKPLTAVEISAECKADGCVWTVRAKCADDGVVELRAYCMTPGKRWSITPYRGDGAPAHVRNGYQVLYAATKVVYTDDADKYWPTEMFDALVA